MATITITFSESVENHVGNQQIGNKLNHGISVEQLYVLKRQFEQADYHCDYYDLSPIINNNPAGILVVKQYLSNDLLYNELVNLDWDKKVKMYGRVVNKHARHNLCFSDFNQEPDYENAKGRIYDINNLQFLNEIRNDLYQYLNLINIDTAINAEGNYYYDVNKCYIGFHGDQERRIVIGLRLGENFPLYYRGYEYGQPISNIIQINLEGGDLYFMSDKAVGYDWHKKNIPTLRHAAGITALK